MSKSAAPIQIVAGTERHPKQNSCESCLFIGYSHRRFEHWLDRTVPSIGAKRLIPAKRVFRSGTAKKKGLARMTKPFSSE
jgi:hypothetical protein